MGRRHDAQVRRPSPSLSLSLARSNTLLVRTRPLYIDSTNWLEPDGDRTVAALLQSAVEVLPLCFADPPLSDLILSPVRSPPRRICCINTMWTLCLVRITTRTSALVGCTADNAIRMALLFSM